LYLNTVPLLNIPLPSSCYCFCFVFPLPSRSAAAGSFPRRSVVDNTPPPPHAQLVNAGGEEAAALQISVVRMEPRLPEVRSEPCQPTGPLRRGRMKQGRRPLQEKGKGGGAWPQWGERRCFFASRWYAEVKCLSGLHCLLEGVLPSQKYCARGIFAFALYCWT
jgi:hypothetical protein